MQLQLTVDAKRFLAELKLAAELAKKNRRFPVLQNIAIRTVANCGLEITVTDLDNWLTCSLDAQVTIPGEALINAKQLAEIVKTLKGEMVITVTDDTASIACNGTRFQLPAMSTEHFPEKPVFDAPAVEISTDSLNYLIEKTIFATCKESSQRYALAGARLVSRGGVARMIATDGHRLSISDKRTITDKTAVDGIVSNLTLEILRKAIAGNIVRFGCTADYWGFELSDKKAHRLLVSKKMPGVYPNFKVVLDGCQNNADTLECNVASLNAAIKQAAIATAANNDGKTYIGLDIYNTAISVIDYGTNPVAEVSCRATTSMAIYFESKYLIDFLNTLAKTDTITLAFSQELSGPVVITSAQDKNTRYVVMPMRGNDKAKAKAA